MFLFISSFFQSNFHGNFQVHFRPKVFVVVVVVVLWTMSFARYHELAAQTRAIIQVSSTEQKLDSSQVSRPHWIIPKHARLLTHGMYRNNFYWLSDYGIPVYDARLHLYGAYLLDVGGRMVFYYGDEPRSPNSDSTDFDPSNPYIPTMSPLQVQATTVSSTTNSSSTTNTKKSPKLPKTEPRSPPAPKKVDGRFSNIQITAGKFLFVFIHSF